MQRNQESAQTIESIIETMIYLVGETNKACEKQQEAIVQGFGEDFSLAQQLLMKMTKVKKEKKNSTKSSKEMEGKTRKYKNIKESTSEHTDSSGRLSSQFTLTRNSRNGPPSSQGSGMNEEGFKARQIPMSPTPTKKIDPEDPGMVTSILKSCRNIFKSSKEMIWNVAKNLTPKFFSAANRRESLERGKEMLRRQLNTTQYKKKPSCLEDEDEFSGDDENNFSSGNKVVNTSMVVNVGSDAKTNKFFSGLKCRMSIAILEPSQQNKDALDEFVSQNKDILGEAENHKILKETFERVSQTLAQSNKMKNVRITLGQSHQSEGEELDLIELLDFKASRTNQKIQNLKTLAKKTKSKRKTKISNIIEQENFDDEDDGYGNNSMITYTEHTCDKGFTMSLMKKTALLGAKKFIEQTKEHELTKILNLGVDDSFESYDMTDEDNSEETSSIKFLNKNLLEGISRWNDSSALFNTESGLNSPCGPLVPNTPESYKEGQIVDENNNSYLGNRGLIELTIDQKDIKNGRNLLATPRQKGDQIDQIVPACGNKRVPWWCVKDKFAASRGFDPKKLGLVPVSGNTVEKDPAKGVFKKYGNTKVDIQAIFGKNARRKSSFTDFSKVKPRYKLSGQSRGNQ